MEDEVDGGGQEKFACKGLNGAEVGGGRCRTLGLTSVV
jgi:hypothetical protein